jgi:perosamine synthetase
MSEFLPYGRQSISQADINAVVDCLKSDYLTCGPRVAEFERAFAQHVGAKHAVAVNSATSALHLAMKVAEIGPGDRVLTSPNTFLSSANCAAFVGAIPDFVDIDPVSYNLDPIALAENWKEDTKAVVAVDYAGQVCDMSAITDVARQRGAIVIEDACHATGGAFISGGKRWTIGGHPWADMTTFSFHPVKTMTTGEGGMLVTDNDDYAKQARLLRSHGVTRESDSFVGLGVENDPVLLERGSWYYEMSDLGFNYRITDLQCALGLSQLDRLDSFVQRRREIVSLYNDGFADKALITPPGLRNLADRDFISWHLYTLQIDFEILGKDRHTVMTELRERGIGSQVLYIPVHLQPYYRSEFGYGVGQCPVAEEFYRSALSLPLYPELTDANIDQVIEGVLNVVA